jgi:hypothetical protein
VIVRAGPPSAHAIALAGVAAVLLATAALFPLDAPPLFFLGCPLRAATGFPCPGCGATHAFHFTARGQLLAALSASPLATLVALASAVHVLWTALRVAGLPFAPRIEMTPALRWAAALAIAANWLFVALRGAA